MKSGTFFKLGDGYIVTDWNERYFVLDCKIILIRLKQNRKFSGTILMSKLKILQEA